jgi:hypothetical protein
LGTTAAIIFALATLVIVLFQLALALGAPLGHLAMGGAVEGSFPPSMRIGAVIQAAVLAAMALIVLRHSGVISGGPVFGLPGMVWVPVAMSVLASVLNAITPSRAERRLWLPVAAIMSASALVVAFQSGAVE